MTEISAATIIISVSLILMGGFAMTRLTKRLHLPSVTAYITVGVLLGPACLGLIPQPIIDGTEFVSDISLAFIAFGVGEFFKLPALKRCGLAAAGVTFIEACIVSAAVFSVMYFALGLDFSPSIVLAATAGGFSVSAVLMPIVKNLATVLLGAAFGALLKLFLGEKRSTDNRLIIAVGTLFAFGGVPLIVIGIVYFGVRLVTKYVGAFVGSAALRRPREVRSFLARVCTLH